MSERVKAYLAMLGSLSSEDLDRSAQELAVREKHEGARLIAHIAEIGERRYHLELGYTSLFQYCVTRLNLSEGSVYRRTQVASVCRRFPQILEALAAGHLHLTGASLIAAHLTMANVERLITVATGKTRREVEKVIVQLAPKETFEPSIRKLPARTLELNEATRVDDRSSVVPPKQALPEEKPPVPSAAPRTRDLLEPATEDRFNVRFSAGNEFTEKLKRLAEILGIECPHNHLEEILDQALEKKDPQRKLERRRKRDTKQKPPSQEKKESRSPRDAEQEEKMTHGSRETSGNDSECAAPTRHIPSEVRERVLEKAGYRCEYYGPDGSRCTSRTGLQVEHTRPFAVHQTHEERHLRTFCPAHNLHAARKFYGQEFIQQKIDAARRAKVATLKTISS